MSHRQAWFLLPVVVATLLLTSCEENKKTAATPPARATAPTLTASAAPAPAQPRAQAAAPAADPVPAILAAVEKEYNAGKADYAAGHLEAAKQDFDRAVNLLLQSPVPVKSDGRLQNEYDRVVEGVNELEMAALKQGDGFSEQKSEPAPIDEANEVTFPVDPNVKARAEAELKNTRSDLPLMMNDAVASYINFYSTRGRGTLERALTRSGRYRDMISRVFKEEGVPQDLIFLAQAESGFHPLALSRAGARGMWQFMASRASGYGLERSWWVDDRQDPEKATRAAAKHLHDLYDQFGDWYLAMAAYNSGPGNVQQAVKRTGYADFWELYHRDVLPKETKNYVPIILAFTIMSKNPMQYGLEGIVPDPPMESDTVHIDYPVDLRLVAEAVDASVDALQDLNPSLLRMTTPKEGGFDLHLPTGSKEKYETAIASIPVDKRVLWRFHRVAAGDTLASIAKRYKTSARAIAQANDLGEDADISAQTRLIIPSTAATSRYADGEPVAFSKRPFRYKVRRGDTVLSVADDFGVPAERLRKWNHLRGNDLRKGRTLLIYKPVDPELATVDKPGKRGAKSKTTKELSAKPSKGRVYHKVKPGETLFSIASDYGTTVEALKRDNPKFAATLHPGDTLVIRTAD
ncbi:MAG TPA: LysM peptidoglycan-binding domain-containing protein [Terriglobales bacterium]|nr:LysM peptidoglycan-binding domain-containing protein [Terriglobales bacterium]